MCLSLRTLFVARFRKVIVTNRAPPRSPTLILHLENIQNVSLMADIGVCRAFQHLNTPCAIPSLPLFPGVLGQLEQLRSTPALHLTRVNVLTPPGFNILKCAAILFSQRHLGHPHWRRDRFNYLGRTIQMSMSSLLYQQISLQRRILDAIPCIIERLVMRIEAMLGVVRGRRARSVAVHRGAGGLSRERGLRSMVRKEGERSQFKQ